MGIGFSFQWLRKWVQYNEDFFFFYLNRNVKTKPRVKGHHFSKTKIEKKRKKTETLIFLK